MLHYNHFTLEERKYLQELLSEGYSIRRAADALGRSPSSVSREIARNRSYSRAKKPSDNPFNYHHWRAQTLAGSRKRQRKSYRLKPGTQEYAYIIEKLNLFWSPDEIAERWKKDHPEAKPFSISTIYRAIYRGDFPKIKKTTHLRRRGKHRCSNRAKAMAVHPDRLIPEWPKEIRTRERIGDWEGDTVYGGRGQGYLVTLVDRKSRYLCARVLYNRGAEITKDAIIASLKGQCVKSISFDNGTEFVEFHEVEKALSTLVYFAEPHKPWQRGTNENTNDLLRFFYPKGYDFRTLSQEELDKVVSLINHRPRKCLGYLSPYEVFYS